MQTLKPIGELIGSSWSTYTKYFSQYAKILMWYLVFSAASVVLSIIEINIGAVLAAEIIISIALIISTLICIPALLVYIASEQKMSISDAFKQSRPRIWAFVWIGILSALVMLGGFSLLMIPGIYLMVCFSFAQYLVICEKKGGMQALWESTKLVQGQWLAVFLRILVYAVTLIALMLAVTWIDDIANAQGYIINIVTLAISFLGPLFMVYFYQIFKDLKSISKTETASIPSRTKIIYSVLFAIGIVIPATMITIGAIAATFYGNGAGSGDLTNIEGMYGEKTESLYGQYLQSAIAEQSSQSVSPSSTD